MSDTELSAEAETLRRLDEEGKAWQEQKEIDELSKQLTAKERICVLLDRKCLKEACCWYDASNERCIVLSIANILAGQKVFR